MARKKQVTGEVTETEWKSFGRWCASAGVTRHRATADAVRLLVSIPHDALRQAGAMATLEGRSVGELFTEYIRSRRGN